MFNCLGISYAWFSTIIEGNENAKKQYVQTGDLRLTYTDTNTLSIDNAFPGDTYEKIVSVKNTGTANANYSLVWQELTNNIINNELVIEGTCKRLNIDGTEEGTCESIKQRGISSLNQLINYIYWLLERYMKAGQHMVMLDLTQQKI